LNETLVGLRFARRETSVARDLRSTTGCRGWRADVLTPLTYWVSAKAECRPEVDHRAVQNGQSASLCHSSVRVTTPGAVLIRLMRLPFLKMTMLWVKLPEQPSVCPVKVTLVVPVQLALTVYVPLSSTFVQT